MLYYKRIPKGPGKHMVQPIAKYKHPLMDTLEDVLYVGGASPEEMLFQISGERTTFSIARLIALDKDGFLIWHDDNLHQQILNAGKQLGLLGLEGLITAPVATPEELEEEEEKGTNFPMLMGVAIILIITVLAFSYFGFIRPYIQDQQKHKAEAAQTQVR